MNKIKVLLVDDNKDFLLGVRNFLATEAAFEVVDQAFSGMEAIEKVLQWAPDVVLMDVSMPGMNGIEATRQIKKNSAPPHVVILTLYDTEQYREMARSVGADDFIPKSEFGAQILACLAAFQPIAR